MPRSRRPDNENRSQWVHKMGDRLRAARNARADSLATVARATGISSSFLSLLEQGRTDVSLGRLLPLLDYYRIGLSEILPSPLSAEDAVVRQGNRQPLFSVAEGIDLFLAAPDQSGPFIPLFVEYDAGARMEGWSSHPGDEYVFILRGSVIIEFEDSSPVTLDVGDSMMFSSQRNHRISPVGDGSAQALVITTRPDPRQTSEAHRPTE
jgi:transcriptional regulator with XRE-family HTH domain